MPEPQPLATRRWHLSSGKVVVLLSTALLLVIQVVLFRPIIADYFPTFDELALVASSTNVGGSVDPLKWITEGYRNYFMSDQEWSWMRQTTDFMRPGGNAFYWLCYELFGDNWSVQLVLGYAAHALCVGLVGYIARTFLRLTTGWVLLSMVIAALNPAYWWGDNFSLSMPWAIQFPAYQTEVVAALLQLVAFIVFARSRFALFALAVTLSLLVKETALTLPFCALLLPACWRGPTRAVTLRNATWIVLPLLVWGVLRFVLHEPGGGMYVLHSDRLWIIAPIRHLLMWPTSFDAPLGETLALLRQHAWIEGLPHLFAIGMNLVWWAVLAVIAWGVWRRYGRTWLHETPPPWLIALVFALGNLGLVVLLQVSEPRFGYFWFALGPAAVFAAMAGWKLRPAIAAAFTVSLVAAPIASLANARSQDTLARYRTVKQSARQLSSFIGNLPPAVQTVFIVDDVFMRHTAPEFTAQIAGYKGKIVRVNNVLPVEGCTPGASQSPRYRLLKEGDATVLDYTRPECFVRPVQYIEIPPEAFEQGNVVRRGPWMSYAFPELDTSGAAPDYGQHWTFRASNPECRTPGACLWLGFDPKENRYYPLQESQTSL